MKKLTNCEFKKEYSIKEVNGSDETNLFFSNIGCCSGDSIKVIKKIAGNYIVEIKDGRFGIDKRFAEKIWVVEK